MSCHVIQIVVERAGHHCKTSLLRYDDDEMPCFVDALCRWSATNAPHHTTFTGKQNAKCVAGQTTRIDIFGFHIDWHIGIYAS